MRRVIGVVAALLTAIGAVMAPADVMTIGDAIGGNEVLARVIIAAMALALIAWILFPSQVHAALAALRTRPVANVTNTYNYRREAIERAPATIRRAARIDVRVVGPERAAEPEEVVDLSDFVEYPPQGPPVIRDRTFRNVVLCGPVVLDLRDCRLNRSAIGIVGDRLDSVLWPLGEGEPRIGFVRMERCQIINCRTYHVAFVGGAPALDRLRTIIRHGPEARPTGRLRTRTRALIHRDRT